MKTKIYFRNSVRPITLDKNTWCYLDGSEVVLLHKCSKNGCTTIDQFPLRLSKFKTFLDFNGD